VRTALPSSAARPLTSLRTFFGGNDTTWSTPNETHTFFRNIALYGATGASTMKSSALPGHAVAGAGAAVVALVATMFLL
jgi:hypothetical protein